jgi:cytochrome oxidase assembly protein ShyY1
MLTIIAIIVLGSLIPMLVALTVVAIVSFSCWQIQKKEERIKRLQKLNRK